MSKVVEIGSTATEKIITGVNTVADLVKTTLGPRGRNVLVRNQVSPPIITNDGVTIAKSIQLKDNAEDAGAQLIIQAANKTNIKAGDGTTTTTVLAQSMLKNAKNLIQENDNVIQVQKDMLSAANEVNDYLLSIATPVKDSESIKRVATISSGSEETGKLLAEAFEKAGEYGSVIIEDSKTGKDGLVTIQGMKLTNGSVTHYLLNDRVNMKSEIANPMVLVTTDKIDGVADLFKILNYIADAGQSLLIICEDIEIEPLQMVLMNKQKGVLPPIAIIRLPGFGQLRTDLVEDICVATGATRMGRDVNITLRDFDPMYLGELEQVIVTMDDTVLKFKDYTTSVPDNTVDLIGQRELRVKELQETMKNISDNEREQYKRRISNLISGISVIQVGGNSEVEIQDKKLRIEDAINSVQSAIEEGIVPGGGYSLLQAFKQKQNKELSVGYCIVYNSLLDVMTQIITNAGLNAEEVVKKCAENNIGFNALTEQYENLIETGVINSVKVDRYSVLNAASVASTIITMGGFVVEENEKDMNVLQLQAPNVL